MLSGLAKSELRQFGETQWREKFISKLTDRGDSVQISQVCFKMRLGAVLISADFVQINWQHWWKRNNLALIGMESISSLFVHNSRNVTKRSGNAAIDSKEHDTAEPNWNIVCRTRRHWRWRLYYPLHVSSMSSDNNCTRHCSFITSYNWCKYTFCYLLKVQHGQKQQSDTKDLHQPRRSVSANGALFDTLTEFHWSLGVFSALNSKECSEESGIVLAGAGARTAMQCSRCRGGSLANGRHENA